MATQPPRPDSRPPGVQAVRPVPPNGTAQRPLALPSSQFSGQLTHQPAYLTTGAPQYPASSIPHNPSSSVPQYPSSSNPQYSATSIAQQPSSSIPQSYQRINLSQPHGPRLATLPGSQPQSAVYYQSAVASAHRPRAYIPGMPVERPSSYPQPRPTVLARGSQPYPQQTSYGMALQRPLVGNSLRPTASSGSLASSNPLPSYSAAYPGSRPISSSVSGSLPHSLPNVASKAIAGPVYRPALGLAARGPPQGVLRATMPQMSRQAYLQQASAQLQNFQGGQLLAYQGLNSEQQAAPRPQASAMPYQYRPLQPTSLALVRPPTSAGPVTVRGLMAPRPQLGVPPGPQTGVPPGPLNLPNLNPNHAPAAGPSVHMRPRPVVPNVAVQAHNMGALKRPSSSQSEWAGVQLALSLTSSITVADRKVRLDKDESSTPMYVLLRRWIQNDPTIFAPRRDKLLIPRRQWPRVHEEEAPPPKMQCDPSRTRFGQEELLMSNKQHWLRVRRHHVSRRHRRLNQFRQRLATLIPDPGLELASGEAEPPPDIHNSANALGVMYHAAMPETTAHNAPFAAYGEALAPSHGPPTGILLARGGAALE